MSDRPDPKQVEAVEVRAPAGAVVLEIDWADGHMGHYPHRLLRGFCPCAHCQGHQGPILFREGGSLELETIEEVGNYALRLGWADGHGTGIYAFPYLRDLCACGACAPGDPTARRFGR
ncbi:MAG: DUF971 domain-containing protein [Polyangiales bacterium]|nr:DUF971 domain-containing protein [Myxococcales bacterium]